jgi:TIR domain
VHVLGHVDADDAARRRGARRGASREPGSAADVDHLVTGADPVGRAKVLVVSAQLGVVEVQPVRRGHRRDAYASKDRDKVLQRVQILPLVGVSYFQDLLNLEAGDRWLRRLELGIDECDLFLLFWSSEAKSSDWVRQEVRHALQRRGGDDLAPPEIKPVIIEGPPVVEPWEELAHLHFNDRVLYFMNR